MHDCVCGVYGRIYIIEMNNKLLLIIMKPVNGHEGVRNCCGYKVHVDIDQNRCLEKLIKGQNDCPTNLQLAV